VPKLKTNLNTRPIWTVFVASDVESDGRILTRGYATETTHLVRVLGGDTNGIKTAVGGTRAATGRHREEPRNTCRAADDQTELTTTRKHESV